MKKNERNIFFNGNAIADKDFNVYMIKSMEHHHIFNAILLKGRKNKSHKDFRDENKQGEVVFSDNNVIHENINESEIELAEPSTFDYLIFLMMFWVEYIPTLFYFADRDLEIKPLPHRQLYIVNKWAEMRINQRATLLETEKIMRAKEYLKQKKFLTKFVKKKAKKDRYLLTNATKYVKELQLSRGNTVIKSEFKTTLKHLIYLRIVTNQVNI